MALFPLAWKPDARHRSLTGILGRLVSGCFSVEDTARLMHGFVPERSLMSRLKEYERPEAAQIAAAQVT